MKKVLSVALGLWIGSITVLVIKNTIDNYYLIDLANHIMTIVDQKQVDADFSDIVENYDDKGDSQ